MWHYWNPSGLATFKLLTIRKGLGETDRSAPSMPCSAHELYNRRRKMARRKMTMREESG
eukprot:c24849_g1_i2 orf=116-292(+)